MTKEDFLKQVNIYLKDIPFSEDYDISNEVHEFEFGLFSDGMFNYYIRYDKESELEITFFPNENASLNAIELLDYLVESIDFNKYVHVRLCLDGGLDSINLAINPI